MSSSKEQITKVLKDDSITSSIRSLDQESNESSDSFKSTRTSTSNKDVQINRETMTTSTAKSDEKEETIKDKTLSNSKENLKNADSNSSSKIDQNESTPSSSSIDLEQMISNLEISDENNELTNSLINLIHKRSSLHESIEPKAKIQMKKLSIVSLDFDGVVDFIKEKKCSKIIVMIGAGVSTSAGIPDFRSPNSGLFSKLKKYNLPSQECIFEINYFKRDPKPFFEIGAEIFASKKYKPTATHNFIKLLDSKGVLLRLYTQNIDGLEAECGLSDEKVVYAHGSFNKSHCLNCNHEYDFEFMKKFMSVERKEVCVPKCEKCNAKTKNVIKPDIVFYGQSLPEMFFDRLEEDFPQCDLLLIIGTSLVVQPFASLVNNVKPNVPRILINRERTGEFLKYDCYLSLRNGIADKCDRDIFLQGESDKIIAEIAEKLGWKEDLDKLNSKQ